MLPFVELSYMFDATSQDYRGVGKDVEIPWTVLHA